MKNDTELGRTAKSYIDRGQLVPDEVTIGMLEEEVKKHPDAKGFIFDGFPRNPAQARALDTLLAKRKTPVSVMLALEVEESELRHRLMIRGKDSGRADDQDPEIIQKRIDVYNNETAPVKDFYSKQKKYRGVQGIGQIEDIFNELVRIIDEVTPGRVSSKKIAGKAKPAKKTSPKAAKTPAKKTARKAAKKARPVKQKNVAKRKTAAKPVKKVAKKTLTKKVLRTSAKKTSAKRATVKKSPAAGRGKKAAKDRATTTAGKTKRPVPARRGAKVARKVVAVKRAAAKRSNAQSGAVAKKTGKKRR
jgi:adenylate kinase